MTDIDAKVMLPMRPGSRTEIRLQPEPINIFNLLNSKLNLYKPYEARKY
ncbi:hypothetical protein OKW09_002473 [Pseudomonas rhodesiae]|nr:hypothetical protein [Pseudomonas rhodesiae]MDF9770188.1 hypothetical protein [Pseudomonas rhodesiae]